MAKNKKRPTPSKKPIIIDKPIIQKPALSTKPASSKPAKKEEEENGIATFLFGHPVIDKKDIIEIIIMITFIAFLVFMYLKSNDII
ncbi:MAG: hypothetical protein ABIG84_08145 [archaeon]